MRIGQLYYPTGELYFVGRYDESSIMNDGLPYRLYAGIKFYKDGTVYREGIFQWGGLYYGREYYPSGKLKFLGQFNDKHGEITGGKPENYYGPSYPVKGIFYGEGGEILYKGDFTVCKRGSLGYPQVVIPEGFGSLK